MRLALDSAHDNPNPKRYLFIRKRHLWSFNFRDNHIMADLSKLFNSNMYSPTDSKKLSPELSTGLSLSPIKKIKRELEDVFEVPQDEAIMRQFKMKLPTVCLVQEIANPRIVDGWKEYYNPHMDQICFFHLKKHIYFYPNANDKKGCRFNEVGKPMPNIDENLINSRLEVALGYVKPKTTQKQSPSVLLNTFQSDKARNIWILEKLAISNE